MLILNRFLNVINLILAIAACGTALLLNQRRIELRERANVFADIIVESVVEVDGKTGTDTWLGNGLGDDIKAEQLGWEAYHTDPEAVKAQLAKINELMAQATQHRNQLSKEIFRLGDALKTPFKNEETAIVRTLNQFGQTETEVKAIESHIQDLQKRELEIVTQIVTLSETINKGIEAGDINDPSTLEDQSYSTPLEKLNRNVKNIYDRANTLSTTLKKAIAAAPLVDWTADSDQLSSEDEYASQTDKFIADMEAYNKKIKEFQAAAEKIEELTINAEELALNLEEANGELNELKNTIGKKDTEIARLARQVEILTPEDDAVGAMPQHLTAEVLEVNTTFDFIVLNKGSEDDVFNKGEMLIHNNGEYVCKVRITRVLDNQAIAEVLNVARKGMPEVGFQAIVAK
ncbi:hypothetical protein PQO03_09160 [Lentisphaera profundi]|uniref:Uncharacterized protein n=1 Tax=Lentisphaera profundi TaxID=1658616 RepID=A0ABY7VQ90_9BACT|nr:hypothetical protein [Lentisphaera profundi]WDE95884.1 hypothetical protein PQO03_09160 [Lentisphaera profundi]